VKQKEAARFDWSTIGPRSHAVQFYNSEGSLLDQLSRYVGTALVSGDAALVIATRAHRDALGKRLKARGFDLRVPRDEGRYVALDAEATLARFMRDGKPDAALFRPVIEEALSRFSTAGNRRVAAFGEMVALLWQGGRQESAIRVEQMWNEVAQDHAFSLCCAYPMSGFGTRDAAPFMKICAQHSHVFTVAEDPARRSDSRAH
jgi:hypothetical protein